MGVPSIILSVLLTINNVILIASVLMQSHRESGLGNIGGAAENVFGKRRAQGFEGRLMQITTVTGIVFIVLSITISVLVKFNVGIPSA